MPNLNLRVKLKKDTASNWQQSDPVLLNGELIIVVTAAGETRFKVGDGTSKFSQLPFVDETTQQTLSTLLSKVDSIDLTTKVDKDQGTAQMGNVLYVGSTGIVSPVDLIVSSETEPEDALLWFDTSEPSIIPPVSSAYNGKYLKIVDGKITFVSLSDDDTLGSIGAASIGISVTLLSSGWSSNAQTVTVNGVTASNNIIVSPAPASMQDYMDCAVYCSAQAANQLTFNCTSVPSVDITVNVLIVG